MSVLLASEIQHLEPKRPVTKTPMGAEKNKNNPTNSPEKPSVSSQRPGTGKPSNSEAVWKRCTLAQHHRKSMRFPTPDGGRGAPRRCLRAGARDGSGELGPSLVVMRPPPRGVGGESGPSPLPTGAWPPLAARCQGDPAGNPAPAPARQSPGALLTAGVSEETPTSTPDSKEALPPPRGRAS